MEAYVEKNQLSAGSLLPDSTTHVITAEQDKTYKNNLINSYVILAFIFGIFFIEFVGVWSVLIGLTLLTLGIWSVYEAKSSLMVSEKNVVFTDSYLVVQTIPFSQIENITIKRYRFVSWADITVRRKNWQGTVLQEGVENPEQVIREIVRRLPEPVPIIYKSFLLPKQHPYESLIIFLPVIILLELFSYFGGMELI